MGGLKAAVTAVCCGAFLCGVIGLFLKNSGISKTVKFTLSLFLCACVVLPVLNVDFSDIKRFDISDGCSINTELNSLVQEQTAVYREKIALKEIQSIAENYGAKIISLSFEKDGYARLVVTNCDGETMNAMAGEIKTATGYTAEVTK